MQKWELIGTQLANTLSDYLDACATLELSATERPVDSNLVVSKLDLAIDSLYASLTQQLIRSRSHIAGARNKFAPTIRHLPDEILAHVFSIFIHDGVGMTPLEPGIRAFYQRLYTLISVCSDWKSIILSRGSFWSLVPVESGLVNRILERSQYSDLYLAGNLRPDPNRTIALQNTVATHGTRFCGLNIAGWNCDTLRGMAASLLNHGSPGSLTDFSICHHWTDHRPAFGGWSEYLFPLDSPEHIRFKENARSLKLLRLGGLHLDWRNMRFDNLTELRVQDLKVRHRSLAKDLLVAAASAPRLNHLHLIRIFMDTAHDTNGSPIPDDSPPISLPSLQWLYLEEVHKDFMATLLHSITPGSYRTVLNFASSLDIHSTDVNNDWGQKANIDILMVRDPRVRDSELRMLLEEMPTLTTLYINMRGCREKTYQALLRPIESSLAGSDVHFPKLHTLYFTDSVLHLDKERELAKFKEVIASHGVKELGLGGTTIGSRPSQDTASIEEWLAGNVPNFMFMKTKGALPYFNFETHYWKLW